MSQDMISLDFGDITLAQNYFVEQSKKADTYGQDLCNCKMFFPPCTILIIFSPICQK
jgi:hypothetical protein